MTLDYPVVHAVAGPGQAAFADGLRGCLGFALLPEIDTCLAAGGPVLLHGWREGCHDVIAREHPGKCWTAWHSGWAGSDVMGEGENLAAALAAHRAGAIRLLWVETRDVPPPGARHLPALWHPPTIARQTAEATDLKRDPGAVAVAIQGGFSTGAKNMLGSLVAAVAARPKRLVVSERALSGQSHGLAAIPRAQVLRSVLADSKSRVIRLPHLPRADMVCALARVALLVHTSLTETWPYLALEAIYSGTPVLISDAIAWAADLPDDVRSASVCPAKETGRMADMIARLMSDAELREHVAQAQRATLDALLPDRITRARHELAACGFRGMDGQNDQQAAPAPVTPAREPAPAQVTPRARAPAPAPERNPVAPVALGSPGAQVTAFLISTGEPSTAAALAALGAQTVPVRVERIDGVTPMWRAFQSMLDRCETPLYVQVDADMVLDPHAVERLVAGIEAERSAMHVEWLWDADVERPIQGVKVYRHEVLRKFPYADALSCEMPQLKALKAAGHRVTAGPEPDSRAGCVGEHLGSQTPARAFDRWQRLVWKHRTLPWIAWLAPYIARLEARWLAAPKDAIAKARYLGAVAGLTGPVPATEHDASRPNQDYRRMAAYLGEYAAGPRELNLYVTDRCNFRCVFGTAEDGTGGSPCMREAPGGVPKDGDLDPYHVARVLDRWPSIRGVCIAGFGEPLLAPHLYPMLDLFDARGLVVGLITNGAQLAQHADRLEQHRIAYLSVSLNAATAEAHAKMSRTKTWDKVLDGVRRMAGGPTRTGLSFVVTRQTARDVPAYLALARELRVAFVHLHNILPHAGTDDPAFRAGVITVESAEALAALDAARSAPGAELVEAWPQPIDLRPGASPHACMSPLVSLGLDGRGYVSGCRRVVPPDGAHGHYDDPAIWTGRAGHPQNFVDLRLAVVGDREPPDGCRGCFGAWRG